MMATIKSYTDINQSKKLAEILPFESADMYIIVEDVIDEETGDIINIEQTKLGAPSSSDIPCWSLAALLGVIRETIGYTLYGLNNVYMSCELADFKKVETEVYDNEVDACYEMIIKLNELKML